MLVVVTVMQGREHEGREVRCEKYPSRRTAQLVLDAEKTEGKITLAPVSPWMSSASGSRNFLFKNF